MKHHVCVLPDPSSRNPASRFHCTECGWNWFRHPNVQQWFRDAPATAVKA